MTEQVEGTYGMPDPEPDFKDARGTITDLLGPVDAVTAIFTRKGAIRGNHVHHATTQWTFVVSGMLFMLVRKEDGNIATRIAQPRELVCEPAGLAHAWRALEDSWVLVFTEGPRSGKAYESDTERLAEPLLS
jgi:dTDP-4-dehydrorhamnose 3,5-epimerase-like enzyme